MFWPGQMGNEHYRDLQAEAAEERQGRSPQTLKVSWLRRIFSQLGIGAMNGNAADQQSSKTLSKRRAESSAPPFRRVL